MQIDLNVPGALSLQSVSALLASAADDRHHQLRVTTSGKAYLSTVAGNLELDDLAFRLETWLAGNGYVGPQASQDAGWVQRIHDCLKANWPNPTSTFIDQF